MAARNKRIFHDENTRAKIQATYLINRLTTHISTHPEAKNYKKDYMDKSQVTAALGLLKKTLPDLSAVEMTDPESSAVTINITRYANDKPAA